MLSRDQLNQRQFITFVHRRQRSVFITFTQRRHHFCPAVETQNTTARLETEITRANGQRGGVVLGRGHLARHELTPDQLIQLLRVDFHIFQRFSQHRDVRRTNRFVRFLRILFAGELVSAFRQVFLTEVVADVATHHVDRVLTQVG